MITAIYCFIDQRIAALLYNHYSRDLSLYKCCLAKFGFTTIIVILQILFDRQCTLRKLPIERPNYDIEMSHPQPNEPTVLQQSTVNSQTFKTKTQPSRYVKRANSRQPSFALQNQSPSFNLRSSMKSTPINRDTNLKLEASARSNPTAKRDRPFNQTNVRDSDSDVNFDAVARNYTV